ncbi:hypothetical protein PLICRDRAFT_424525 [Plicaturopsis crispa FD-325 SS-3]|nr:hypothetical protein PLICRDRAFT_424525 [Plicaturopsis crispa FD-325 SS-3]
MRISTFLSVVALPVLVLAQSAQLSTSFSTGITLGPNRQESTVVASFVVTVSAAATSAAASASGNSSASASSNATATGNSTITNSASSTTTPSNLPTAATNVDGGGNGPGGAPSPGATAGGTVYGPDDGYIAAAAALKRNAAVVGLVGLVVGGGLAFA